MKEHLFPIPAITTEELPIFTFNPPSKEFREAIHTQGSPAIDCELCGRTHFDLFGECMEEEELNELLAKQQKDPRRYCGTGGIVYWGYIETLQAVIDCPCHGLRLYEDFISNHSRLICEFIIERNTAIKKQATERIIAGQSALATKT